MSKKWFLGPILLKKDFYLVMFMLQTVFYFLGMLGYAFHSFGVNIKILYAPFYFLLINIAGVIGLFKYLRREKVVTWKAATTTR